MQTVLAVGMGGFIGSVLRYGLSLVPLAERTVFPIMTLIVNVIGSFVIGLLAGWVGRNAELNPAWLAFLKVGICGGFTTFSTFALESTQLMEAGRGGLSLLYIVFSIGLGIGAVFLGQKLMA